MVLGAQAPGRVGCRRFSSEGPPRGGPSSFSVGVASLDSAHMAEVSLRLLGEDDLTFLSEVASDESTRRFTRIPEPPPAGFAQTWFGAYEAGRADGTREAFVVVEEGSAVGLALAASIDREAATAELGYLVAAQCQGPWTRHRRPTAADRLGLRRARDDPAGAPHRHGERRVADGRPPRRLHARGDAPLRPPQAGAARGHPDLVEAPDRRVPEPAQRSRRTPNPGANFVRKRSTTAVYPTGFSVYE